LEKVTFTPPEPASDLSKEATDIYRFYVDQGIKIRNPGQIAAFVEALRAMDRANQAREILKAEGLLGKSKRSGLSRRHPACEILTDAERHFRRIWKGLGLYGNAVQDGFTYVDIV
jgi:phage terminase small subunit